MNDCSPAGKVLPPWKILIADDDQDVHAATRMALRGIRFRGRALTFVDAYSGAETLAVLQENPDTAIIFLDVIMETEDAGLAAARWIRESGFSLVRIIIRTGFPGQAPERQVIVDYDIHDYKEKTGLSVQKLFTSVISALRAYDDLVALENHRRGLMSVLESVSWFDFNAVQRYVSGMLAEFSDLVRLESQRIVMLSRPSSENRSAPTVIASLGNWPGEHDPLQIDDLAQSTANLIGESFNQQQALSGAGGGTVFLRAHGVDLVVFAAGDDAFASADEVLLEVFLGKVCQAISNYQTFTEMASVRDAMLYGVALRAERWNANVAVELEQLSALVSAIALRLHTTLIFPGEIDHHFLRHIGGAALLHDLGNESIPLALSGKCGELDADERRVMQSHVGAGIESLGYFLQGAVKVGVLNLAAKIISGHHERLDGSGYPAGLQGDAIPLAARLFAVADAFVAMTSPRPHRPAMSVSTACAEIKGAAGSLYDPRIVEVFLDVVNGGFGDQGALT
jgi:response regulator RpfG family c-di-GMP phosphodiesterase